MPLVAFSLVNILVILLSLNAPFSVELQVKFLVLMFTVFRLSSIPLLMMSPKFPTIVVTPVNPFAGILPKRFVVCLSYRSNEPLIRWFKNPKSRPRLMTLVDSQVRLRLAYELIE
ncbi:hypothetical protein D3C86_1774840 [compost metagenome]